MLPLISQMMAPHIFENAMFWNCKNSMNTKLKSRSYFFLLTTTCSSSPGVVTCYLAIVTDFF